jgi:hypothetical protein
MKKTEMKKAKIKIENTQKVKKEKDFLCDIKITKEIRLKRDALDYNNIKMARW